MRASRFLPLLVLSALAFTGCASATPPVSDKVAAYYESHKALQTAPTDTRPVVAFVGDSYTEGKGASAQGKRWTTIMSTALNIQEVNLGRGGTGYVTTAGQQDCGLAVCPAYTSMVVEAIKVKPKFVVVAGGQNDFAAYAKDPASVDAAVRQVFLDLHNSLPDARIIAVGPSTPYGVERTVIALDAAVQREAHAVGATYVSLINPDVIAADMIAPDRSHVNDSGHAAIARTVAAAMG